MAIKARDFQAQADIKSLEELIEMEWPTRVTAHCKFVQNERKRNEVPMIPTMEDTVKFASHVKTKLSEALAEFKNHQTRANYRQLQEANLVRTLQFNRKRGGDVSESTVVDFQRAMEMNISTTDEIFKSLTEQEQVAARSHKLLVINGKCNKNNYCILDSDMKEAFELIINWREFAGIPKENKYVFAVPTSQSSHLNPSKIRAKYASEAGVDKMVVRGMRKYVATNNKVRLNIRNLSICYLRCNSKTNLVLETKFRRLFIFLMRSLNKC
jgi:hypothetical protein